MLESLLPRAASDLSVRKRHASSQLTTNLPLCVVAIFKASCGCDIFWRTPQKIYCHLRGGSMEQTSKQSKPRRFERIEHSRVEKRLDVVLHTDEGKLAFKRSFETASRNLYALDVICAKLLQKEKAEVTAKFLDDSFAKVTNEFNNDIAKAQILYDNLGIKETLPFTVPETFTAKYSTFYAKRFIELILLLDRLVTMLESIRVEGGLKTLGVSGRTYERQQRVIKFANSFRKHSQDMWSDIKSRSERAKPGELSEQTQEAIDIMGEIVQESESPADSGSSALAQETVPATPTAEPTRKKAVKAPEKQVAASA